MKKSLFILTVALLAGCADVSSYTTVDANASAQTKMRACMIQEANSRFQAGTLFVSGLKETSSDLVNTCLKKLALQAAGISEESQTAAQNIITNLKSLAQ